MAVLFIVLAVVAVGGVAYASWYLKQKRIKDLAAAARQLGLEFSAQDSVGCLGFPFALLGKGDGRGAENVMWGTWQGSALTEFDYWYYEESTDSKGNRSKTYYRFSCAMTEIEAACSHLTLERENVFTRIADHIGLHDIEFESDEFNRAFNVKAKDRKFANDLLDARMMQWLVGVEHAFQFESSGRFVLAYSKRRSPTELIPLLGTLQQFVQHVPHVVYDLYPIRASG